ncbi:MAG: argininosuccinate lyase [Nitrososphaeraceae archaeon]|nr:argininosuccinate lyase [Nitrososphaeraceae archaeon]
MYRSRQKENLDKKVLDFLSSLEDDLNLFYYDIIGTQAHCLMLRKIGILNQEDLSKILASLNKLKRGFNDRNKALEFLSNFNSSAEDIHEQVESLVIQDLGIEIGGKIHTGRSRNDQVVLDILLRVRDDILIISEDIIDLIISLIKRSKEFQTTIVALYTHLQQAQIGTFSHYLLSYSYNLLRDNERINSVFNRINKSPLGACAIGGTGIPIDREFTASLLGFEGLIVNSIDATTCRDVIIEFLSILALLMTSLNRISEDFILWSTSEFNYIELDDKYSSTSSVMPQKKNPDPLEILRSHSSLVIGNLFTAMNIVKNLPSGYSRDLQDLKSLIWKSTEIVKNSLVIITGIIDTFKVNEDIARNQVNLGYGNALDIAEEMVIKYKIPFRKTHQLIGNLVEYAIKHHKNLPLNKLPKEEIYKVINSLDLVSNPADLVEIIKNSNLEKSVYLRRSEGSPNPEEQKKMVVFLENTIEEMNKILSQRKSKLDRTFKDLEELIIHNCKESEK